jgi:class 3 adenylate cyclase
VLALSAMNQNTLKQKLEALTSFPEVKAATVARIGEVLKELNDWELFRINPLRFAEEHNFDQSEVIDSFVHGARVGLFDFAWNMLCPSCGSIVDSYVSMNDVEANMFHCTLCHCVVQSSLDDCVEVAFTINPSVHQLDIQPFRDIESYWHYFRSANHQRSSALEDYIAQASRESLLLEPEEEKQVSLSAESEAVYRVISVDNHVSAFISVTDKKSTTTQRIDFSVLPNILTPKDVDISAGNVTIAVRNLCKTPTGVIVVLTDLPRMHAILCEHPSTFRPFLTGKMLLNNQSFRELFRVQTLLPELKLRLRSLTLLFTDLKGSTSLYDQTGDVFAYSLVQEHYKILTESVRQNSGAVIKTMGDAIMATFSTPVDGVRAALQMMQKMNEFNSGLKRQEHALGLKIGIHEGSALAVNAEDRLDYFGHAVNVASRVQGLAQAEEICVTEQVLEADGVRSEFAEKGYIEESHLVSLKGIGRPVNVYQLRKYQA